MDLRVPRVPALALGAGEASLLELTGAYAVFASGGIRRPPTLITAIATSTGETLYAAPREETRVIQPGVAYLVTHLLERVVDVGTAQSARAAGLEGPAAGKTGTTDETRDAWFVGYTPDVVAGVWVGRDDARSTGLTGAAGALPIWTEFVKAVESGERSDGFPVPDDVVWRDVDPGTGGLATAGCPARRRAPFVSGTEPRQDCPLHRPLWTSVEKQLSDGVRAGGRAIGSGGQRMRDWFRRLFR
jgi:membrane peptidoglycan carboxypeptidase